MDYIHTLARATQKALVSAHNEFHKELYTPSKTTQPIVQTTPQASTISHIQSPSTPSTPKPAITKTELNQLREALFKR